MLQMEVKPEGLGDKAADVLGLIRMRAKADMERFKDFIERRGVETGAWSGEVDQDKL
jgi:hypothetical protein